MRSYESLSAAIRLKRFTSKDTATISYPSWWWLWVIRHERWQRLCWSAIDKSVRRFLWWWWWWRISVQWSAITCTTWNSFRLCTVSVKRKTLVLFFKKSRFWRKYDFNTTGVPLWSFHPVQLALQWLSKISRTLRCMVSFPCDGYLIILKIKALSWVDRLWWTTERF